MREMVAIVDEENKLPYEEFKKKRDEERKILDSTKMTEMVTIVDNGKSKEEKEYLMCIRYLSDDYEWDIIKGRKNAYEYIKDIAEYIDLDDSFVLVETLTLDKRINVYKFMKHVQNSYDDGFDINDVIINTETEEENKYEPKSDIDKLSMESFINGEVGMTELN